MEKKIVWWGDPEFNEELFKLKCIEENWKVKASDVSKMTIEEIKAIDWFK